MRWTAGVCDTARHSDAHARDIACRVDRAERLRLLRANRDSLREHQDSGTWGSQRGDRFRRERTSLENSCSLTRACKRYRISSMPTEQSQAQADPCDYPGPAPIPEGLTHTPEEREVIKAQLERQLDRKSPLARLLCPSAFRSKAHGELPDD